MKTRMFNERINQSCFSLKLLFLLLFMTACGGIVPGPTPKVEKTSPVPNEKGVLLNKSISVTFSKKMASETLTSETFLISDEGENNILGDVLLTGQTATFTLKNGAKLAASTLFKATITMGVKDFSGKTIPSDHVWTFKTAALGPDSSDNTPPRVEFTNPEDRDGNVALDTLIVVTFSEAIDPATITPATFDISRGGTFLVSGNIVTLTPDRDLRENKGFTVIIKGAGQNAAGDVQKDCGVCVKDLAGNPLEEDKIFSFRTETPQDQIQ